ncbi:MAG TPA: sensor domain-containing diguanylate cyclase [Gallionella sp.]|nr:sensor domain-containing diguanylate cyclase [Gallionella sp.]
MPDNEAARLDALKAYGMLDTPPESFYDDIVQLAAYICQTPIAAISFIDGERQWFKASVGVAVSEIPRQDAFCAHAILQPDDIMIVKDAFHDPRFSNNPLVTGNTPVHFYAGVPIVTDAGEALGTLCVIDTKPRDLGEPVLSALRKLARQIMAHLELGKSLAELQNCQTQLSQVNQRLAEQNITDDLTQLKNRRGFQLALNAEWERTFRYSNPLSLLLIDVDECKAYKDKFGRAACDEALLKVAQLIGHSARELDSIARLGDDEFAVVLPETDSEGAFQIAERIRYRIELADWPNQPVTVSIGVTSYNGQADADTLLVDADQALRRAKQIGRNCTMSTI